MDARSVSGAGALRLVAVVAVLAGASAVSARAAPGLTGSYRVTLGVADLVRAGVPSVAAVDETGTWTLTLARRRWTLRQEHAPDQDALDRGVLLVAGGRVGMTLLTSDGAGHRVFLGTFGWRATGRMLRLSLLADQFPTTVLAVLVARPWERVP